jgi:response regulator of citrate/malate metabolism
MTDWTAVFKSLPDEELDNLAVLRIIECSNGIIQYMLRNSDADALSLEEASQAIGFSRSTIRRHTITIENN